MSKYHNNYYRYCRFESNAKSMQINDRNESDSLAVEYGHLFCLKQWAVINTPAIYFS